jgi:hypothetical protein
LEKNFMPTIKTKRGPKRRSALSERMKKGELYVVYSGFGDGYMRLLSYGDSKRTPRIYKRKSVDDRLSKSLPVCRSMATAEKVLKREVYAVLLPLSEMVFVWGEREVKSWAKAQRHVSPTEVREYVARYTSDRRAA